MCQRVHIREFTPAVTSINKVLRMHFVHANDVYILMQMPIGLLKLNACAGFCYSFMWGLPRYLPVNLYGFRKGDTV